MYLNGEVPQNSKRPKFFLREYFRPTLHKEMYADDSSLPGMMPRRFGVIYIWTRRHMPLRPEPPSTPHILRSPIKFFHHTEMKAAITLFHDHATRQSIETQGVPFPAEKKRFLLHSVQNGYEAQLAS